MPSLRSCIPLLAAASLATGLLASCSSSSSGGAAATPPATPIVTRYGEHAMTLAKPVKPCTSLHFSGSSVATGMIDIAECTLMHDEVTFYTWASKATEAAGSAFTGANGGYRAEGVGWTAQIDEASSPPALQKAIATTITQYLKGTVIHISG